MGNVCGARADAVDVPVEPKPAPEPEKDSSKPAVSEADKAASEQAAPQAETQNDVQAAAEEATSPKKLKVFIIFYSTYGHIFKLAETFKSTLEGIDNVDVRLFQVAETLPASVLEKMHAAPKPDVPIIDPLTLPEADAFVFGFPTRFGAMCSQMVAFFDATGSLWQNGALHGKPATLFTSTGTQGGGQETTLMTAVTQLAHHGMIYVPPGYVAGPAMFNVETARGASAWGAGTLAGPDGSRQPSEVELEAVRAQAKMFARVATKLTA